MLLILNYLLIGNLKHVLCDLRVAGGHLVESSGKTDNRMCELVGNAFSIGSPPELCHWVGVSLKGQPEGTIPPGLLCSDSQVRWINLARFLQAITLKRPVHQEPSPLAADSPASHGGRECLMRLMGSHYICCTPSLACSAPFAGG